MQAKSALSRANEEKVSDGSMPDEVSDREALQSYADTAMGSSQSSHSGGLGHEALRAIATDKKFTADELLFALKIPTQVEIPENILFVDENLDSISFSESRPRGYDMGQVDAFVKVVRETVIKYVELLQRRGEDLKSVAAHANAIQEQLNGNRFNAEIANGINIMSSDEDSEELRAELSMAQLRNSELEAELAQYSGGATHSQFSNDDAHRMQQLQDDFALLQRENAELRADISELRANQYYDEEETAATYDSSYSSEGSQFSIPDEKPRSLEELEQVDVDLSKPAVLPFGAESSFNMEDEEESLPMPGISQHFASQEPMEESAMPSMPTGFDFAPADSSEEGAMPIPSFELPVEPQADGEQWIEGSAFEQDQYQPLEDFIASQPPSVDSDEFDPTDPSYYEQRG
jgi:DivIVA domain-containing protein